MKKYTQDNQIKNLIALRIQQKVNEMMHNYLIGGRYLALTSPSKENEEHLRCIEVACKEIKEHMDALEKKSSLGTELTTLSSPIWGN